METDMPKKGRKPEYRLKVYEKATGRSAEIGAGWLNGDGSISISLNLCTVLAPKEGMSINLFPIVPDRSGE